MTLTINVTQEHIDHGRQGSCRACPIAMAVTDLPDCGDAFVRRQLLTFKMGINRYIAELPASAMEFIQLFDASASRHVAPFSFSVDAKRDGGSAALERAVGA
mgnify:CR=1 FL=1